MGIKSIALVASTLVLSTSVNAALVERLGGLAIYDDDLNITWLADANVNGLMDWNDAISWADSLTVGGYTDWRLPETLIPDSTCAAPVGSSGFNCSGSELGHLFYSELSGTAGSSLLSTGDADIGLFSNVQSHSYWSATERSGNDAYGFSTINGNQNPLDKGVLMHAWAVRTGDVSAVPIPTAAWLFGSGLISLVGLSRRKA